MDLNTIVAAADESDEGRRAVLQGAALVLRARGRLIILRILSPPPSIPATSRSPKASNGNSLALQQLERWIGPELVDRFPKVRVEYAARPGLPHVEIGRFAEEAGADLLVLGRKRRSPQDRLLLGDTADAVARRSQVPCLFTADGNWPIEKVLVAVDGTDRGFKVYQEALGFAAAAGARLRAVLVEPPWPGEAEGPAEDGPGARELKLLRLMDEAAPAARPGSKAPAIGFLNVRRGDPAEEVLTETTSTGANLLVVGFHRGGPAGVIEAYSVARRLVHSAPCAVLTIPL